MTTMQVDLVSAEEQIFSGEAEYIVAPARDGELGIYPHHMPLISKLRPGVFRVKLPGKDIQLIYAISGGFIEVQGNKVSVLADIVERTDDLDEAKLLEEKRKAEERLKASGASMGEDDAKAYAALEIIIAQLKAIGYINKHIHRS